jgi:hypothetical protein
MTSLDSAAVFEARALDIGLSEAELKVLHTKGWDTFGRLAFSCGFVPGGSDETPLLRLASIITECGAQQPDDSRLAIIRRLFFESYTLAAADLKNRIERTDDDLPRRLANPERFRRHSDQVQRLNGLSLTGEMEIAHALVDKVVQMYEDNQLRYLRWEEATKRDQELMGVKLDPVWKPDSHGVVREFRVSCDFLADTSTDLLLQNALRRRSLAFDQTRLISFNLFEVWSQILIEALLRSPPYGYQKVSIEQLHAADLELFKFMMSETRNGIRSNASGLWPLEAALKTGKDLPQARLHLQPLQGSAGKRTGNTQKQPNDEMAKLRKKVDALSSSGRGSSSSSSAPAGNKGEGKSKGKSRAKGKTTEGKKGMRLPLELVGLESNYKTEAICFNYNLGGCTAAKDGERCGRGWHVCMKSGCFKPHGQRNH